MMRHADGYMPPRRVHWERLFPIAEAIGAFIVMVLFVVWILAAVTRFVLSLVR